MTWTVTFRYPISVKRVEVRKLPWDYIACEPAPKWGIGRRPRYFSFRPIPHLGACSQARDYTEYGNYLDCNIQIPYICEKSRGEKITLVMKRQTV